MEKHTRPRTSLRYIEARRKIAGAKPSVEVSVRRHWSQGY